MPQAAISMYMERLPARQAEQKLGLAQAASIPHMAKEDRKSAVKTLERQVNEFGTSPAKKPAVPAKLKMMGIGVRFEREGKTDD